MIQDQLFIMGGMIPAAVLRGIRESPRRENKKSTAPEPGKNHNPKEECDDCPGAVLEAE